MLKKIIFSLIICINLSVVAFTQTSVDQIFINSKKIWQDQLIGNIKDITITNTEDIIVVTEENLLFHLYFLNNTGKKIWEKTGSFKSEGGQVIGLDISKNGETIIVHGNDTHLEMNHNWIYDREGNLLFANDGSGCFFASPSGEFLVFEEPNNLTPFLIFDKYGEKIDFDLPAELLSERLKLKLISDNELLVYSDKPYPKKGKPEIYLFDFPSLQLKWKYELAFPIWLIEFNFQNCISNSKYIVIQGIGIGKKAQLFIFDKTDGSLIFTHNENVGTQGLSFFNEEIIFSLIRSNYLLGINIKNKELLFMKKMFDDYGFYARVRFSYFDNFISIFTSEVQIEESTIEGKVFRHGSYSKIFKLNDQSRVEKDFLVPNQIVLHKSSIDHTLKIINSQEGIIQLWEKEKGGM